ncbi:MAG: DUF1194 domain-containing protein [Paracoccaceae bacterium]
MPRPAFALFLATAPLPLAAQEGPCRQALALGLDVSGSVDGTEYRLQLDGLAAALAHPDVTAALLAAAGAPVSLAVYEWSGPTSQAVIVDWTAITDTAALDAVTARLRAGRRTPADPSTALGTALLVGGRLLGQRPGCWKRTLDISGDGRSNTGPRPQDLGAAPGGRDHGQRAGDRARRDRAARWGARAARVFRDLCHPWTRRFRRTCEDFATYEAAMVRKLLKELQGMVVGAAEPAETLPGPADPGPAAAARTETE